MRLHHTLPLVALAALASAQGPEDDPAPSPGRADVCRVTVLRGRARLLGPESGDTSLSDQEHLLVEGRAHLEVPTGSEVRIAWLGRASLHVWGPSALEWSSEPRAVPEEGLPRVAVGRLEWTVFDLAWMNVEVRRGTPVLRLPGDWRADLGASALHLRGLPSGPFEVRHHAGRPLVLRWLGDTAQARPPLSVHAGSTLRILRPLPARTDRAATAEAWEREAWPWRSPSDTPHDRAERAEPGRETRRFQGFPATDPEQTGPVGSVRGFPDPTQVRAEIVERGPTEPERTPLSPLTGEPAPQRPRPETVPEVAEADESPGEVQTPEHDPEHWRGFEREDLAEAGAVAVERRPDVEVRVFASGRYKVLVDALAEEGAWVFAPDQDWRLEPGAVVLFEPDGELGLGFGRYEPREKAEGRPGVEALAE